jgi:hypothetical protein
MIKKVNIFVRLEFVRDSQSDVPFIFIEKDVWIYSYARSNRSHMIRWISTRGIIMIT